MMQAQVHTVETSREEYDALLRRLLNDCNNPPMAEGGRPDGIIIDRPLCASIVNELILLRAATRLDQRQLIDMVTEMTFTKTISDISNMIDSMAQDFDCEHMGTVARVIREIKLATQGEKPNHAGN